MRGNRVALFVPSMRGGGAERVMLNLACGIRDQGLSVDLLVAQAEGPYLSDVPSSLRLVDLRAHRVLASLPALVGYLRREHPRALLSAMCHTNLVTLWAKRLSGANTRVVVSVHNTWSVLLENTRRVSARLEPFLIRRFFPWADGIVAVSGGVADDLSRTTGLARDLIEVIFNPVITPELLERAKEPLGHPWFVPGAPPVVVAVGRLMAQKDYPTLIKAFKQVVARRPARLVILGEGPERPNLEALVRELGLTESVAMPGFVDNPFAYIARAAVFVLSSAYEGLPTVLIEALAIGTPIVSTDCPSGPQEILQGGRLGRLVPVGDSTMLAEAITETLGQPHRVVDQDVTRLYSFDTAVDKYLGIMLGRRKAASDIL